MHIFQIAELIKLDLFLVNKLNNDIIQYNTQIITNTISGIILH